LKQNNSRDINEAIFGGILGFSVVLFSLKDFFSPDNKINFLILIIVYTFASIFRIFGIVLDSNEFNNLSIHYCRLILVPYTIWAIIVIILTEINLFGTDINSIISFYFFVFPEILILTSTYGIRFKFQSPIVLEKEKFKKE